MTNNNTLANYIHTEKRVLYGKSNNFFPIFGILKPTAEISTIRFGQELLFVENWQKNREFLDS